MLCVVCCVRVAGAQLDKIALALWNNPGLGYSEEEQVRLHAQPQPPPPAHTAVHLEKPGEVAGPK